MHEILFKNETYQIIGHCMKVHSQLGIGFREVVYKDALEIEFKKANIIYEREKPFDIRYEGIVLPHKFEADFFVFNSILLEIKAMSSEYLHGFNQTLNYLKSSEAQLALLINFGMNKLQFQRIINTI